MKANSDKMGMSLVEVTMTMGISAMLMAGMFQMNSYQNKRSRSTVEKIAALDSQRALTTYFTPSVCQFMLTDPSQTTNRSSNSFDSTHLSSAQITFKSLLASNNANAPTIATVGQPASPVSSATVVKSISLKNFSGSSDQFTAYLQIEFDPTKLEGAVSPASIVVNLQTNPASPLSSKTITSCTFSSAAVSPAPTATPRGPIVAVHNQSCPTPQYTPLWSGKSYLGIGLSPSTFGASPTAIQLEDLGGPGSCVESAYPMMIRSSDKFSGVDYLWSGTTSFFLSAGTFPLAQYTFDSGTGYPKTQLLGAIGNCSVCQRSSPATILVTHCGRPNAALQGCNADGSAKCPSGANVLWTGYSFAGIQNGNIAGGQSQSSPGSCLPTFTGIPFVRCTSTSYVSASQGRTVCTIGGDNTTFAFWLTTDSTSVGAQNWTSQRNRSSNNSWVSRCAVCEFPQ